jgi:hypothetical protein
MLLALDRNDDIFKKIDNRNPVDVLVFLIKKRLAEASDNYYLR